MTDLFSSPGTLIRDAIIVRMQRMRKVDATPFWKLVGKNPATTKQPEELPYIGVFSMRDRMTADGGDNIGEPRFNHEVVVGISIADMAGEPEELERDVEKKMDIVLQVLLTDPTFLHFGPDALFEAVTGIERERVFPNEGEKYAIEGRLAISFRARTDWPPVVTDPLETIHVTSTYPDPATANKIPQVIVEFDLDQEPEE